MVLEFLPPLATLINSLTHLRHSLHDAHEVMASSTFERAVETVEHLRLKLPPTLASPRVAIVCGSGLGGLAETVNDDRGEEGKVVWEYKDVPNFPVSTGRFCSSSDNEWGGKRSAWMELNLGEGRKADLRIYFFAVPGHAGRLIFSTMGEHRVPVVLLVGRAQYVETLHKRNPSASPSAHSLSPST